MFNSAWEQGFLKSFLKARIRIQNPTPLAETKKALQPHGAGLKIKSTDRPADLAEFGADPQNPFPNGRRATPQASRREAQATREAYRKSARPFYPRSLANPPRRGRELRFPQFEACAKTARAKFLFIGTAHDRTPERVVANLSRPAHENKTILTPLRAVRNSIVTSVRSLERPAQNPKFARTSPVLPISGYVPRNNSNGRHEYHPFSPHREWMTR